MEQLQVVVDIRVEQLLQHQGEADSLDMLDNLQEEGQHQEGELLDEVDSLLEEQLLEEVQRLLI